MTQVVPHPTADLPLCREYRSALGRYAPEAHPDFASLEGYIDGRLVVRALGKIEGDIDRSSLLEALESSRRFDLGLGVTLRFDRENHQASKKVWATRLTDEGPRPFAWKELQELLDQRR